MGNQSCQWCLNCPEITKVWTITEAVWWQHSADNSSLWRLRLKQSVHALGIYFRNYAVAEEVDTATITQCLWQYMVLRARHHVRGGIDPKVFAVQCRKQLLSEAVDYESSEYVMNLMKAFSKAAHRGRRCR